ncbi:MAG: phage tail sheath subtilisin-like domain-containing protein [bacterium]|nr:phage tail sheath subtilisin-like domain-containing protein [bacterium]
MPTNPTYPGVYIEEVPSGVRTLVGVATSVTAFVGTAAGPAGGPAPALNTPVVINNFGDYERIFGGLQSTSKMSYAVRDYYVNGGAQAVIVAVGDDDGTAVEADYTGSQVDKTGIYALEDADIFNMLCIPDALSISLNLASLASVYCEERRAMFILDAPTTWTNKTEAVNGVNADPAEIVKSKNTAIYFPRLLQADPLDDNNVKDYPPCGAIAGVIARTDVNRGVWKAPAGLEATFNNVLSLNVPLTDAENGELNPLGVNCLRVKPPAGRLIWGARTTVGDDATASEWKYVPVRRLALNIEESLFRGTQWVVFEPNDEPLWAQIRLNVGAFMQDLFRKGAFQGTSPNEAYFVKCDREVNPQNDIDKGIVNILVGFAPLKPAEFVIIKLQQIAGQVQT